MSPVCDVSECTSICALNYVGAKMMLENNFGPVNTVLCPTLQHHNHCHIRQVFANCLQREIFCHTRSTHSMPGSRPTNDCACAGMSIKKVRLPCWPWEVNRCHTRGECEDKGDKTCKWGNPPGFESRHHQKSKARVSVTPLKGLMSSKNINQNKKQQKNLSHALVLVTPRELSFSSPFHRQQALTGKKF